MKFDAKESERVSMRVPIRVSIRILIRFPIRASIRVFCAVLLKGFGVRVCLDPMIEQESGGGSWRHREGFRIG